MLISRLSSGLCAVLLLTSCVTDDPVSTPAEPEAASVEKPVESPGKPEPRKSVSKGSPKQLSASDIERLSDGSRPHLPFFGAVIYADRMDFSTGKASGDVFIDGSAMNAQNEQWPKYVYAEEVEVDLANEIAILSGYPVMEWSHAHLRASSPLTMVYLSREKYRVDGPAQYGLSFR